MSLETGEWQIKKIEFLVQFFNIKELNPQFRATCTEVNTTQFAEKIEM